MKVSKLFTLLLLAGFAASAHAQSGNMLGRALWATIATKPSSGDLTTNSTYMTYYGKVLVSWRMLPGDDENTTFDLYRKVGSGEELQLNRKVSFTDDIHYEVIPIAATNYQDNPTSKTQDITYRLTYSGSDETLATYTITRKQLQAGQPYISIPLQPTDDVYANTDEFEYQANDASVGDLDGDGEMRSCTARAPSTTTAQGSGPAGWVMATPTTWASSCPSATACRCSTAWKRLLYILSAACRPADGGLPYL